ncbi:hypothetical protein FLJC2902T_12830 [Flavobacterium limnosediminis JC2902]|uniref:Uncharacterized protein n=1 Tax=Flavobacterium limnosediminis JC2902 TaxID=1341181 RepID=V6SR91_9FLAO|nr:hypothetical protein [Flavobacterium limnosediminis]ESU28692.1 hypothetical protein FLJC2902T_12830 [Flavobacterium limnosediminis JC2902]
MADQAAILAGKEVVKINDFTDLKYSIDGFLLGFTHHSKVYRHFVEDDVVKVENSAFQQKIAKGYYDEEKFLLYRKGKMADSFSTFIKTKFDDAFKVAANGDQVKVKKIKLVAPYTGSEDFGQWLTYTLPYNGSSLLNSDGSILNPIGDVVLEDMHLEAISTSFYLANIPHANAPDDLAERYQRALLIAKIAININNIVNGIFPLFEDEAVFTEIKNSQIYYWAGNVFVNPNPTTQELKDFLNATYNFWRSGYLNKKIIQDSTGIHKLYNLVVGMSVSALTVLTAESKLNLLQFIVRNATIRQGYLLFNNNEDLVLRVVKAVVPDQADEFLRDLVDASKYSSLNSWSLFDRLFNDVDDSFIGIGDDNRKLLAMNLYLVWQVSSCNPYQNSTFSQTNLERFTYNRSLATNPDPNDSAFDLLIENSVLNFQAAPITLNYVSDSSSGFYFDNFDFYSTNVDSEVKQFVLDFTNFNNETGYPRNKILAVQDNYKASGEKGLYGTYDYYQPVSLINANQSAAISIPVINVEGTPNESNINSLIPIFVLKYIDGKNRDSNFRTGFGYFIDFASLFVGGYGAISKIRHLRALSGFASGTILAGTETGSGVIVSMYVATGAEAINFTGASISLYLKIITNSANANAPWLVDLKNKVMWLEILSATGSVLAERMVRTTSRNLVNKFNENGWPQEFVDDPRGLGARHVLEEASGLVADIYNAAKTKIRQSLERRISDQSDLFTLNFNDSQLDQLMQLGLENNLPNDEIKGILFASCRNAKLKDFTETSNRLLNWSQEIKPRGYSYKFNSLALQNEFGLSIKNCLNQRGLPIDDVRIQGSSLLTSSADDSDIGIFIGEDKIGEIKKYFNEIYSKKWVDPDGNKMYEKINKSMNELEESIKKGIIKSNEFGKKNGLNFVQELYPPYPNGQRLNISIIIKGRNFDVPPYIKL